MDDDVLLKRELARKLEKQNADAIDRITALIEQVHADAKRRLDESYDAMIARLKSDLDDLDNRLGNS